MRPPICARPRFVREDLASSPSVLEAEFGRTSHLTNVGQSYYSCSLNRDRATPNQLARR